jgi:hypothetical protein
VRLTTARLRALIVDQASFVAAARAAVGGATAYGNPQRAWLQIAIRAYYADAKNPQALWQAFDDKVQQGPQTARRQALAEGARRLLEMFLALDETDAALPADTFPPARDVQLGSHIIAVRRDLIYLDGPTYRVRQLWTDHAFRPTHPRAGEMAAAVMVSVDSDLGQGSTTRVDVWGLRHGQTRSWTRAELAPELSRLRARIDAAEAAISQP